MGLIKAISGATGGVLADQWKEFFVCESMPADVLAVKGHKTVNGRSSNTKGTDNIITTGSVITVQKGQCMLIVEQGKIVEVCAEEGQYVFDASTEPSIMAGGLKLENIKKVFATIGKRFTFGGVAPKDQRVYYFNTKEIMGNKYGTPSTVPYRVVDKNIGLDIDINVRCFGEYSYKITNPLLFYSNVCGNVTGEFKRDEIDSQLKTELLTALQEAFAKISALGIRYSALPGHTTELADSLNEVLTAKWRDLRGIEIVTMGVSSIKADEEDEKMIKELQRNAVFQNANMGAAHMVGATAAAMQSAAKNEGAGSAMAFMGMNMAGTMGGANIQNMYQQGAAQQAAAQAAAPAADAWVCPSCGKENTGNFCMECGTKKPADGWTCPSCGKVNKGNFCTECGAKKPADEPLYKCDKCGWEPEDPKNPPKFCPQCGDPFGEEDIVK